jgi:hypothetical protein
MLIESKNVCSDRSHRRKGAKPICTGREAVAGRLYEVVGVVLTGVSPPIFILLIYSACALLMQLA